MVLHILKLLFILVCLVCICVHVRTYLMHTQCRFCRARSSLKAAAADVRGPLHVFIRLSGMHSTQLLLICFVMLVQPSSGYLCSHIWPQFFLATASTPRACAQKTSRESRISLTRSTFDRRWAFCIVKLRRYDMYAMTITFHWLILLFLLRNK